MPWPWDTFKMRNGVRRRVGRFDTENQALGEALKHQDVDSRAEVEGPGVVSTATETSPRSLKG
jgi:hypothetical protein